MNAQSVIERLALRAYGSAIGIFYPQLRRLPDPLDRWRALMILALAGPRWKGWLVVVIMCCAAAVGGVGIVVGAIFLQRAGWPGVVAILIAGAGGCASLIALWCLLTWIDGLRTRDACRRLMDNLEAAACSECGYSLLGHLGAAWVVCPECGARNDLPRVGSIESLR